MTSSAALVFAAGVGAGWMVASRTRRGGSPGAARGDAGQGDDVQGDDVPSDDDDPQEEDTYAEAARLYFARSSHFHALRTRHEYAITSMGPRHASIELGPLVRPTRAFRQDVLTTLRHVAHRAATADDAFVIDYVWATRSSDEWLHAVRRGLAQLVSWLGEDGAAQDAPSSDVTKASLHALARQAYEALRALGPPAAEDAVRPCVRGACATDVSEVRPVDAPVSSPAVTRRT